VPGIVSAVNGRKIAIALTDRSAWDFHPFTVKRWAAAAILFLVWFIHGTYDNVVVRFEDRR
jgi:hypothetical protein